MKTRLARALGLHSLGPKPVATKVPRFLQVSKLHYTCSALMATYLDTKLRVKIVVLIQYNYKDYKFNAELRVAKGNLFKSYIKLQVIHFFDTGN